MTFERVTYYEQHIMILRTKYKYPISRRFYTTYLTRLTFKLNYSTTYKVIFCKMTYH